MYLTPEKELYTIIQQFYSGKFNEIISLDLEVEFDFSNVLYSIEANFYKIRSLIIVNDLENASDALSKLETLIVKNSENNSIDDKTSNLLLVDIRVLSSYIEFKQSNKIDTDLLDSIDDNIPSLSLIYKKIIQSDLPISPDSPDLDLEAFIYLIFQTGSSSSSEISDSIYKSLVNLKSHYNDSIILDFAIAWAGLSKPTSSNFDDALEIVKSSFYFFDELSSSSNTESSKNLINLLVSNVKLGNLPESLECLEKLNELNDASKFPSWNYSLLINMIAVASINLQNDERVKLTNQIKSEYANSVYVNDLIEKEQLFDSIVASYN